MIELRLSADLQSSDSEFEKSQQYLGNRGGGGGGGGGGGRRMAEGFGKEREFLGGM